MGRQVTLAVAVAVLVLVGLLPLMAMLGRSLVVDGDFTLKAYEALWQSGGQLNLMSNSLVLSSAVTLLATLLGVPLGVLFGKTDLPFRAGFAVLLSVPLLIPSYVIAVAWFGVLGEGGWISALVPQAPKALSSMLFGLAGCIGVLLTTFVPIVILLTMTYLGAINPRLEQAGRLADSWPAVLRRITLPLLAPAILLAAALVFLLTFGELGVPTYLRFPVYPVETLTQFAAFYDFSAATAAAMPLLAVTIGILVLEHRLFRKRALELRSETVGSVPMQISLGRWRTPTLVAVLAWGALTVVLPLAVLLASSWSLNAYVEAFDRAGASILRSLGFAVVGATLLTLLGFFLGYLVHQRRPPLWRGVDALALFLFTLPGTVIGIGLISLWNRPWTNFVYATPAIVVLGYVAQYAVIPTRMTAAILDRIPRSLEGAAQLSGASWFMTLREIILPLARRGLVAVWVIGYVFCLRDLGVSMVVYPPGSDTLPVRILTLMANGSPSVIAALCVILIGVTLLPLAAAAWWGTLGKRGARA